MKLVRQGKDTKTCGHCCVAMLANAPVEEVIKLIGHDHGTRTTELRKVLLRSYGIITDTKLRRTRKDKPLPKVCILHIKYPWNPKHNGHWVILKGDIVYCPTWGKYEVHLHKTHGLGRIVSYLQVLNYSDKNEGN